MHGLCILASSILSCTVKEYCRKSSVSQYRNIAGNHHYHSEWILQEIISITVKEYCRKSSISQWRNTAGNHQYHSEVILQEIISITVKEYCKKSSISQWKNTAGNHQYHSKGILQEIFNITVKEYCRNQHHHGPHHSVCTVSSCKMGLFIVGSSFSVNSSILRAILFIHPWNVLQAAGSTPANVHLWYKVHEI